jgi:N-acetylglucosaminyldiphosphoundecaprenol N-acetyl-beta-D-mannosaminyltransferase
VWLGKWHGHRTIDRVYGPDLMLRICDASVSRGLTHYLYGGAPGVAEELASRLRARFPGLRIVGYYTPPFRPLDPEERADLQTRVTAVMPDFFWVGLSTPKQERFMAEFGPTLDATIMLGVGAAFDMHSGRLPQAPHWMQRSGLEWFYRLLREPRRLFWRYARNNPLFVARAALQLSGLRRYD